ncbi:MAG: hypothetical protein MJY83_02000 [Bacteroidales bacterium]|nr:hypothetical protein [Bacteroidales bacterium]
MSRKVILTLIISILLSVPAVAQKNGGKVDSTYRVSTHEGLFTFKGIAPGKVYIKATSMGMSKLTQKIKLSSSLKLSASLDGRKTNPRLRK